MAGPGAADTVAAVPIQGLVLEAKDELGRPAMGVLIRFTGLPVDSPPGFPSMLVDAVGGSSFASLATETTDVRGRAVVRLQFGTIAGSGRLEVSVPEWGIADTVGFTVSPGAPASIRVSPRDTALYPGASVGLLGKVVDRFGNPRADPVTYTVVSTPVGAATIIPSGLVTGLFPGRVTVVVAAQSARDSSFLSVVPRGTFAAIDQSGQLVFAGLDGSGYRVVRSTPPSGPDVEPAWSPDGTELAITPSVAAQIDRVQLNGTNLPLVLPPTPGLGDAFWPAYSPDGQFIYFSNVVSSAVGIARIRRDGSQVEILTTGADYRPSISPDSRLVAFHSGSSSAFEIVLRLYDTQTGTLLPTEIPGRFPEWSPRGDSLALFENGSGRLMIVGRDGTGRRYVSLPGRSFPEQQMSWSPDGRWLLLRDIGNLEVIEVLTGLELPIKTSSILNQPAWQPAS